MIGLELKTKPHPRDANGVLEFILTAVTGENANRQGGICLSREEFSVLIKSRPGCRFSLVEVF